VKNIPPDFIISTSSVSITRSIVESFADPAISRSFKSISAFTKSNLEILTQDVLNSTEIEGEILDKNQVRSSIARRLGLEVSGLVSSDRNVDAVVEVMIDATKNFD